MKYRTKIAGLTLLSMAISTQGLAQTPPAAPTKTVERSIRFYGDPSAPDISGVWQGTAMGIPGEGPVSNSGRTADGSPPIYWAPWPLPYTPEFRKVFEERLAATKRGVALGDTGARCLPFGLPNMLASKHYPDEFIQTPGQVTIYPFGTFPVTIWTDGRPHPANFVSSYNGHSIGHWVGDTLHVETIGIRGNTPLDSNRDAHSDKLRLEWTIRRVTPDTLHLHLTLFDDGAFTEPVTITNIYHRKNGPEWALLDDQSCFENNQHVAPPPTAEGFTKF
ncbi:hypothetical protein [Sphingomonas sp.]|uniref:hypothetical protein n=1 Tax=Sphingomonas sp. TaxID=28214 RepID=UPI0025DE3487|nr:hypothetical protein [Sphingomonas sp.]